MLFLNIVSTRLFASTPFNKIQFKKNINMFVNSSKRFSKTFCYSSSIKSLMSLNKP